MKSTLTTIVRLTSCPPTPLALVIPFTLFYFYVALLIFNMLYNLLIYYVHSLLPNVNSQRFLCYFIFLSFLKLFF